MGITPIQVTELVVERLRLHQVAPNQNIRQRNMRPMLRNPDIPFITGFVTTDDLFGRLLFLLRDRPILITGLSTPAR